MAREESPAPGRSTLITSAPMSARIMVQYGPAMCSVRSSTFTASSGPRRFVSAMRSPVSRDVVGVLQHVGDRDLVEDGRERPDHAEGRADWPGEERLVGGLHRADRGGAVSLELGEQLGHRHVLALGHLALVVAFVAAFGRAGGRLVGGGRRRARDLDQPRVGPLDRRDVGEDLPPVPAVLVAALFEPLGWHGAHEAQHLVSALVEGPQQLGLGRRALARRHTVVSHRRESGAGPATCQVAARSARALADAPDADSVEPRATPPSTRITAVTSESDSGSPSQSVAVTTATTGVASRPSEVVTAGSSRLAVAAAQYATAVPPRPR